MATYRNVTWNTTVDKNLDRMGYKVWVPLTVTTSSNAGMVLGYSGSYSVPEKYAVHFKTEEEMRKYIDYCKDANASADSTAVWTGGVEVVN